MHVEVHIGVDIYLAVLWWLKTPSSARERRAMRKQNKKQTFKFYKTPCSNMWSYEPCVVEMDCSSVFWFNHCED